MRQREPRKHDAKFLAFVRTLPCCACGKAAPSEAAHIRTGNARLNKPMVGLQEKPDDKWCIPLCGPFGCHAIQHTELESEFWRARNLDPFAIAIKLYAQFGGDGGNARKPRFVKPRKPKAERTAIQRPPVSRQTAWPTRKLVSHETKWPSIQFHSSRSKKSWRTRKLMTKAKGAGT